jgi:hypothetical protein
MSFGESIFSAGFNKKNPKEDLFVKGNHVIPLRKQRGKTLEDSRRRITEAKAKPLTCGASHVGHPSLVGPTCQPRCYVGSSPP